MRDINPTGSSIPVRLVEYDGLLFFIVDDLAGRKLVHAQFNDSKPAQVLASDLAQGVLIVHVALTNGERRVVKLLKKP